MLLLAACTAPAGGGQVVARVDGAEITRRELLNAFRSSGLPADTPLKAVRARLIERIVERRLVLAEARRQRLDQTPDYLAAKLATRDDALIDQFEAATDRRQPAPSPAAIAAWLDAHVIDGSRRLFWTARIYRIEARCLPLARSPADLPALLGALSSAGCAFREQSGVRDTLEITPAEHAALAGAVTGQPRSSRDGEGGMAVEFVLHAVALPIGPEAARAAAVRGLRVEAGRRAVSRMLGTLRRNAHVEIY